MRRKRKAKCDVMYQKFPTPDDSSIVTIFDFETDDGEIWARIAEYGHLNDDGEFVDMRSEVMDSKASVADILRRLL